MMETKREDLTEIAVSEETEEISVDSKKKSTFLHIRKLLVFYDAVILFFSVIIAVGFTSHTAFDFDVIIEQFAVWGVCIFASRLIFRVYHQVWRYGGIQSYLLLIISDGLAFIVAYLGELLFAKYMPRLDAIPLDQALLLACLDLLAVLACRMFYRVVYKKCDESNKVGKFLLSFFRFLGATDFHSAGEMPVRRTSVAIVGAGRVGVNLARDLAESPASKYKPKCFIDTDASKVGRCINGLQVYNEDEQTARFLLSNKVEEVIIALPQLDDARKKELYLRYDSCGFKVLIYDYPHMEKAGKRTIRQFEIEELLFRKPVVIETERMRDFYHGKVILITGGGGSIGSEMCRQVAKYGPEKIVVLDVYENGAYDIQQELRIKYGSELNMNVEICSICDRDALIRVFEEYHPQIVIMAAAHKHVPLMEKNCIEAVKNNVFGTLNTVEVSEMFNAERVLMVSTDKAVNPTNVMGATKRMCEMIVLAHSAVNKKTTFSITRFGNVLGSAGSVIPLFKKQIANGGPITITDERIVRFFMSIPEAASLVLCSATLEKGSVYVLDMGQSVKILELAQSMIKLTGATDVEIKVTGLRPGEKLFEETLVDKEKLTKTENSLIFVDSPEYFTLEEMEAKYKLLRDAIDSGSDEHVKSVMKQVVPTYKDPEVVNEKVTEEVNNLKA